jgi:hypothetical protein
MAFQDKFRAFQFGLPLGVPACELAGEKILFLHGAPLELSDALPRWLMLHAELVHNDSPACALRFDELGRVAVTWPVWGQFLDWMSEHIDIGNEDLHGEEVLFLDAAPMEFRHALRHWLDAIAPAEARYGDSGRAALTWDGWETFISWVQDTLSEALHALETAYDAQHEN